MKTRAIVVLVFLAAAHAAAVHAKPRIAVLTPDNSAISVRYARALEASLETDFRVVDPDLAASAYASLKVDSPFNQTLESAKSIGTIIGCDHFILVKAETARRSSSAQPNYFEASAFVFVVNGRNGRLEKFLLAAKQADSAVNAENQLTSATNEAAARISSTVNSGTAMPEVEYPAFDPDAKSMRPAMPYRRIKPEYTSTAFLYDVKAIVDAEVSIDTGGNVKKVDIVRWAGFGLDEAVIDAVNKMNWRAGERNGKPLAMHVLLRYNFTKIDKDPSASSSDEVSPRFVQVYGIRDQHAVPLRVLVASQLLHSQ